MTPEQWKLIRVGDVVLDRHAMNNRRRIHGISVMKNKKGQRGRIRCALTVDNLKSTKSHTVLFVSDVTGPARFDLP